MKDGLHSIGLNKSGRELFRSKDYDEQREHFIERLQERYEMTITNEEYDKLCNPHKVFHGIYAKQRKKTVGWVMIKGVRVWVLRDGEANRLATCYPPEVEHSITAMMRSCFSGVARLAAIQIYRLYLKESEKISKMKFDSIKDAALYFFSKTKFAPLHIEKFKNYTISTAKACAVIHKILSGSSEYVELSLCKKRKSKKQQIPN